MSPRLAFAIETATLAAKGTLRHFQQGVGYELKGDDSPVTVADREAEAVIRRAIESAYPGEAILGEEEGGSDSPDRWVIDPIDGTKSFLAGVPLFATLLSYEQDGRPIIGVCVVPALDETVFAERDGGAFWNGKPCRVSSKASLSESILSCGSHGSMVLAGRMEGYLALARSCLTARGWTDAYGHVLVATGRIEAMVDPIVNHWDVSAMALIVREAGGLFTDFTGVDAITSEAISATPGVHAAVVEAFAK